MDQTLNHSLTHSVLYVGTELLGQLKMISRLTRQTCSKMIRYFSEGELSSKHKQKKSTSIFFEIFSTSALLRPICHLGNFPPSGLWSQPLSADHPRGLPSGQHRVPGSLLSNNIGDIVFVCMVMILFQIVLQGCYVFCFIYLIRC